MKESERYQVQSKDGSIVWMTATRFACVMAHRNAPQGAPETIVWDREKNCPVHYDGGPAPTGRAHERPPAPMVETPVEKLTGLSGNVDFTRMRANIRECVPDRRDLRKDWHIIAERMIEQVFHAGRCTMKIETGTIHEYERGYDVAIGDPVRVRGIRNRRLTTAQLHEITLLIAKMASETKADFICATFAENGIEFEPMIHGSSFNAIATRALMIRVPGSRSFYHVRNCKDGTVTEITWIGAKNGKPVKVNNPVNFRSK